ncbi:alanine--tRNA ligase [Candidatus Omnitrophota bacterium]
MKTDLIRQKFLDFFASKGHKIVPSDNLIPSGDPTVLFTSAGMNQFKKQFLGHITDFKRAASSQKCLRTDDLLHVGKTPVHHTFFEMLGNFSFGDYFKDEAIAWAWEFLTDALGLPKEKLWVSVYKDDAEAFEIWLKKIKLPKERVIKLGDKENFWPSEAKAKGPNGPCGPCSEIFYDFGKDVGCKKVKCSPACSCGRFSEVWNLVFTQFNRKEDATLEPLPSKNIDTGMGLERLASVLQGATNNFDTDLFVPIIASLKKEIGIAQPTAEQLVKMRVIADHMRAITFAISDGVNPSNEDRGYIIRKLIRISVNNYKALGVKKPVLYKIVASVVDVMKQPYPELMKRRENIAEMIKREEGSFLKILKEKEPELRKKIKTLKKANLSQEEIAQELGKLFFTYYDTSGVPVTTSTNIAMECFTSVEAESGTVICFERYMPEQKKRSRAASAMGKDVFVGSDLKLDVKATAFEGYEHCEVEAKIVKLFDSDNKPLKSTKGMSKVKVILDKTPFYGESGGQIGDAGILQKPEGKITVEDTRIIDGVVVHLGEVNQGIFSIGDTLRAAVDYERRISIARNHTATHLLQAALKKVLGDHVQQQGSLVAQDRLRFDFSHFKQVTKDELNRIEEVVNSYILRNDSLSHKVKELTLAKKEGALAFFGEKYAEKVRVVSVGDYSKELCGGTHLRSTGEVGLFSIISESSVAQGIRRIEATTGKGAYKRLKQKEKMLSDIGEILKVEEGRLVEQVSKMNSSLKKLNKSVDNLKLESFKHNIDEIIASGTSAKDITIIQHRCDDADFGFLRSAVDMIKRKIKKSVIALGSIRDNKALIVVGLTDDVVKQGFDASELIKEAAALVEGSGGGRKDFAQAGGNKKEKLNEALQKIVVLTKERITK